MENNNFNTVDNEIPIVVPNRILVFAGHPDDELISCGGTIIKYQALGSQIIIVVATSGLGGYAKNDEESKIEIRRKQEVDMIRTALDCKIIELGYSELSVDRDHVSEITNLIREIKPQVILLPHYSDFHRVHRNLSLITKEAIYHSSTGKAYGGFQRNWTPLGVYYYESPSCKFQYIDSSVFITVDIEKYWEKKRKLFNRVYKSQSEVLERVIEWAEDTAILRGNEINSQYGEAYIPDTTYTPLKILLV
jgi:LmbE family N-acetylglucosaminyl deacetylase